MKHNAWFGLAALAVLGVAWAVDPPAPATPPATPPAEDAFPVFDDVVPAAPAPAPESQPVTEDDEEETLPPLPEGQVQRGPTAQRFDPTEEVRADFPVSFPVDI